MARQRNIAQMTDFGGVDLSTPILNVADNRAISLMNIIKKNGVNQKRKGWEQIAAAPDFTYHKKSGDTYKEIVNPKNINGLWSFVAEDNKMHVIAHIGKCLFEVDNIGKKFDYRQAIFTPICKKVTAPSGTTYRFVTELVNEKTKAVISGNRLYILGGYKYLVLMKNENKEWILTAVEDSKLVYIPTTTIGITYIDSPVPNRKLLDDVNLLSSLRKNKLISGTLFEGNDIVRTTRFYEYELDTDIDDNDKLDDSLTVDLDYMEEVE